MLRFKDKPIKIDQLDPILSSLKRIKKITAKGKTVNTGINEVVSWEDKKWCDCFQNVVKTVLRLDLKNVCIGEMGRGVLKVLLEN